MISQFKKFIVSLFLLVVLFCGLSASAYAADTETYLYNGVELPALPEWDKETYPYVIMEICDYETLFPVDIHVSTTPFRIEIADGYNDQKDYFGYWPTADGKYTSFSLKDGNVWHTLHIVADMYAGDESDEIGHYAPKGTVSFWANYDIYTIDGNLFLPASDPIPVSSKIVPDLISRTYSFTDTTAISEITLMNLDPLETYKVYWSVYDMDDNLLNHGYSEQIGEITGVETATAYSRIINLKPATTYQLSWNLYTDDEIIPVNSINTVTTLGVSSDNSGDLGGSGNVGDSGNSGDSGSMDGTGSEMGEDDISGTQGDGNTGILMQILNKLSAIFDFLTGDKEADDTPEQAIKDATSEVTQAVADQIYNNDSLKITADTVSDTATIGSSIKSFFTSNVSVGEFFNLFNDNFLVSWFSEETAADLNTVPSVATFSLDDTLSEGEQLYYGDRDKLFSFLGIGGVD